MGATNPSSQFVSLALDMGWRLAVSVLVPIIGGFELDQLLNSGPWLTILGFMVAIAATAFIFRQTLQISDDNTSRPRRQP